MSNVECLAKIPVEKWTVNLRVEPNRPLAEAEALLLTLIDEVGNLNDIITTFPENDFPWSLLVSLEENDFIKIHDDQTITLKEELIGVSGTFELIEKIRKGGLAYSTEEDVVRDLINGGFHHPRVLKELGEAEMAKDIVIKKLEAEIQESTLEEQVPYDSENLIVPIKGRLRFKAKGNDIVKRTRIESITNITQREAEVALHYRIGDNNWVRARPIKEFEGSTLLTLAQNVFQPKPIEEDSVSWRAAPEIRVLKLCSKLRAKRFRDKELLGYLPLLVKEATDEINNSNEIRAEHVEVETGTEYNQQFLIKKIISKSRKRCVLLSSFLSPEFADDIAKLMNDTVPQNVEVSLLHGHAEDIGLSEAEKEAKAYQNSLKKHKLSKKITVRSTRRRTHAKLAINDQGDCWIGSYNFLSSPPESEKTECGVLIHSVPFAEKLLQKLLSWDKNNADLEELRELLSNLDRKLYKLHDKQYDTMMKAVDYIQERVHHPEYNKQIQRDDYNRKIGKAIGNILYFFRGISDRPIVRVVDTDEHSEVVLGLVRDAQKIMLASDRIKKHGLDPSLIRLLSEKETRLLWGREDPKAYRKKDSDVVEARRLIGNLNKKMKRKFLLTSLKDPMMSHAKVVQADDMRILITSDNILSYRDTSLVSDSRELGVLIDSPRISTMVRGELELLHKELRLSSKTKFDFWKNQDRWAVALTTEVVKAGSGKEARTAINMMVERCFYPDGGQNKSVLSDFQLVQGRMKNEQFIFFIIKTAKSLGLLKIQNKGVALWKKLFKNEEKSDHVINNLPLSIPDHTPIWEEGK